MKHLLVLGLWLVACPVTGCRQEPVSPARPDSSQDAGSPSVRAPEGDTTTYTYLALGDSYTVGQSVEPAASFPYQTIDILRHWGWHFSDPRIIAVTGWTTDELAQGILAASPLPNYDVVTLLIGVNDQYRGYGLEHYREEFKSLLTQAVGFAGGQPDHVVVLSIPDWGVTPFGQGSNPKTIAREIDAFNEVNEQLARTYQVHYLNITPETRQMGSDASLVAPDGLHPSGREYVRWAQGLAAIIAGALQP